MLSVQPNRCASSMRAIPAGRWSPIEIVHQHADDLAEAKRDDGEIVAAQPQHRNAGAICRRGRQTAADQQHECKGQVDVELARGQQRPGIGADGVEGDIAEVEQAGIADDDVQPQARMA